MSSNENSNHVDVVFTLLHTKSKEGMDNLKVFQTTKNKMLKKEKDRLERKYGVNHPRVKRLYDRIKSTNTVLKELDIENQESYVEVPEQE
ncbi:hypothetical protein [Desulfogranum japonicum]|uniref:hypothetical protein n=1 Tax=Desulfogranum japonicum TaxID=231447 RepID=UPI00048B1415|nr:hypothetical protein [Desulfogranum japonicum]